MLAYIWTAINTPYAEMTMMQALAAMTVIVPFVLLLMLFVEGFFKVKRAVDKRP